MCNPVTSKSSVLYHFLQDLGILHFDQMFCFMMFIWMADTFLSSSSHSGQHPTNSSLQCSGCTQRNLKGVSTVQRSLYILLLIWMSLDFPASSVFKRGCIIKIAISPADAIWRKKKCIGYIKGAWEQSVCVCLTWLIILLQLHSTPSACLDMFGGMSMKGFKCSP